MSRRILYGFDPLCGWCYGLIPAWRAFRREDATTPVEVLPGGLIKGARVGPYSNAAPYIRQASARMTSVTGQALSEAFFALIEGPGSPISASAPPSHAVLQVPASAALDYAHALQEAHFREGADLSQGSVLARIAARLGHDIDAEAAETATEETPRVAESFARAQALEISSFPTTLVLDGDREIARIDGVYDPAAFTAALMEGCHAH